MKAQARAYNFGWALKKSEPILNNLDLNVSLKKSSPNS